MASRDDVVIVSAVRTPIGSFAGSLKDFSAAQLGTVVMKELLERSGVKVVRYLTGSYVTSLEMAGCSITVTAVTPEFLALWDAPVHTAALRWGM